MKKKITTFLVICSFAAQSLVAQKLPNIQEVSVWAPSGIRIDGKPTEWNSELPAFNKSTNVAYMLSNDNDNLYLLIECKDAVINKKIVAGGITFSINADDKRKTDNAPAITYPILKNVPYATVLSAINRLDYKKNTPAQFDSVRKAGNKVLTDEGKEIKVTGIKAIQDTLISIYNENGIKAAMLLDDSNSLIYELAVPLKLVGLSPSPKQGKKFMYNIMLNGMAARNSIIHKVNDGL